MTREEETNPLTQKQYIVGFHFFKCFLNISLKLVVVLYSRTQVYRIKDYIYIYI